MQTEKESQLNKSIGDKIIEAFNLKKIQKKYIDTMYGRKTNEGIGAIVSSIISHEIDNQIKNQFVLYSFQKNIVKETNEVTCFIFLKSSLWNHSIMITEKDYKELKLKTSYKSVTTNENACIVETCTVIHGCARN